jgi:type III pantothenate kinase
MKPKTLLAIDIGNTTITCGLFRGSRLVRRCWSPSAGHARFTLRAVRLPAPDDVIIAGVVPAAVRSVARAVTRQTRKRPLIVGSTLKVPVKNRYRIPAQVGQDRLVYAYAAVKLYGAPAVVVDYGTAVTFDMVSRKNEYLGGMIFPGLRMSLEALHEKTALLPKVSLHRPSTFIGRSPSESSTSGLVYGYAAMTRALASMIRENIGSKALVIATGGDARFLKRYCGIFDAVDPDLTLKGLRLIYEYHAARDLP